MPGGARREVPEYLAVYTITWELMPPPSTGGRVFLTGVGNGI